LDSPELGLLGHRVLGVHLPRLVIIAVLTAALPAVLSMQTTGPAAAPLIETQPAEFPVGPPPLARAETGTAQPHSNDPAAAAGTIDVPAEAGPIPGWFDKRELKLGAADDDKSAMFVDPAACVYPDAFLRSLVGGRDDCGLLKPGANESEILTLPFLALSAWVVVICAIAGLHHFYRHWRVWRWLRSMRAKGLVPSGTNWRRPPQRRHRRSSRHRRTASRRYAG
jgi:hypothetical protein